MPVTVLPNNSGPAVIVPKTKKAFVRSKRPATATGVPSHDREQSATHLVSPSLVQQNIAEDVYRIYTIGKTLLQSTFIPTVSRRLVYEVTTDVASHNYATTIVWSFDPQSQKVNEVARIAWSISEEAMVEMRGVRVPVTELLTKSRWRLGMSSSGSQKFTSEMEVYKWISRSTLFSSESCSWHCVVPLSRGTTVRSTILSVYRPPSARGVSRSSKAADQPLKRAQTVGSHPNRPSTSKESAHVHSRPSYHGSSSERRRAAKQLQPAVLEMYPEVDSKPHLREIIILTAILVVVHKDEWRNLPHLWENVTTSDVVLSRLSATHTALLF